MYKILTTLSFCTILFCSCNSTTAQVASEKETVGYSVANNETPKQDLPPENTIQVAILLDVSSSMDGLINQAKSELWGVVNEIGKAKKNGKEANLQIALYDYGKSSHSKENGYVRKLLDFTGDLDTLSEVLFSLNTNGGDEYCGTVIKKSVEELNWQNNNNYDVIFIAGNEEFTQGKVNYETACNLARQKNIYVNTIHCGDNKIGIQGKWKDGAKVGGGEYFYINSNSVEEFVPSPYDDKIELLNEELNGTYWGYGKRGMDYKANQAMQDNNNGGYSKKALYDRASTKVSSKNYEKASAKWDITSKAKEDESYLSIAKDEELPDSLKGKSIAEKKEIVAKNSAKRDSIAKELQRYSTLRSEYLAEQRKKEAINNKQKDNSLGRAMADAIRKQAAEKGFVFED